MKVEVTTPDEYQGDLLGDLNRRRGKIQTIEAKNSGTYLFAEVPLSEMFGYATSLRSQTQGRATYTMEFAKYAHAPQGVIDAIAKKQ